MKVEIEVDLRPKLGAIRDQGARPTCLAHATTAAHEKCRGSTTWLSPEYLHFFATGGISSGVTFAKIADTLKGKGQPVDADCPYLSTDPPSGWKPRTRLTVFRRDSHERTGSSLSEIERLIRGEQVPVLGIALTNGFCICLPGSALLKSNLSNKTLDKSCEFGYGRMDEFKQEIRRARNDRRTHQRSSESSGTIAEGAGRDRTTAQSP